MRPRLQRALRWLGLGPATAGVLAGTLLAALLLGFLPLFGGPGYESALGLGLLLPLPVACACALEARSLAGVAPRSALGLLLRALRFAFQLLGLQLCVL